MNTFPRNLPPKRLRFREDRDMTANTGISKKIVKEIKVEIDKCTGCRACEMACSAFHAKPRFSSINPARARIRGKEYSGCSFCGASCPSGDYFREPDSGLPLKCDMCESIPPLEKPWCVQ